MNLKTITFDLLCAVINQTERKTKYFRHARLRHLDHCQYLSNCTPATHRTTYGHLVANVGLGEGLVCSYSCCVSI